MTALLSLDRIADQPQHRWPQSDEQGAALRVSALVLVDGLGPDPEPDAQADRAKREQLCMPCAESEAVKALDQHDLYYPTARAQSARAQQAKTQSNLLN